MTGAKTCQYGHHWYIGPECPLCEFFGRENLEQPHESRGEIPSTVVTHD